MHKNIVKNYSLLIITILTLFMVLMGNVYAQSRGYDDQKPNFDGLGGCSLRDVSYDANNKPIYNFREEHYITEATVIQNKRHVDRKFYNIFCWGSPNGLRTMHTAFKPIGDQVDKLLTEINANRSTSEFKVQYFTRISATDLKPGETPPITATSLFLEYDFIKNKANLARNSILNASKLNIFVEVVTTVFIDSAQATDTQILNVADIVVEFGNPSGGYPVDSPYRNPVVRFGYKVNFMGVGHPCLNGQYNVSANPARINLGGRPKEFFESGGIATSDLTLRVERKSNPQCLTPAVTTPYITIVPQSSIYGGQPAIDGDPMKIFDNFVRLANNTELRILDSTGAPVRYYNAAQMGTDKLSEPSAPDKVTVAEASYKIDWRKGTSPGPVKRLGDGSFKTVFRVTFEFR